MPKKNWTDEERKAFGAKMRTAKANKHLEEAEEVVERLQTEAPVTDTSDVTKLTELVQQLATELQQLKAEKAASITPGVASGPQVNPQGSLIGTFEKYITNPARYPDPTERLSQEERLRRFAFDENFELRWEIGVSAYTTLDNVRIREPKFILTLVRKMYDNDTGELTNNRYDVCNVLFHEDPETALVIAQEQGIDVDSMGEKAFLDEMRYLRMLDWLLECFYPPKSDQKPHKKEVVIGNRLVEVYEISSEKSSSIPFDKMGSKKL